MFHLLFYQFVSLVKLCELLFFWRFKKSLSGSVAAANTGLLLQSLTSWGRPRRVLGVLLSQCRAAGTGHPGERRSDNDEGDEGEGKVKSE